MVQENGSYLAIMLCMYALFEFLVRRAFLVRRGVAVQGVVLLSIMLIGSSGFVSWRLAGLYLVFAVLYVLLDLTSGKLVLRDRKWMLELFVVKQVFVVVLLALLWSSSQPIVPNQLYSGLEDGMLRAILPLSPIGREQCPMVLLIVATYGFVVDGGTRIVRGVLAKFPGLYTAVTTKLNKQGGIESEENVGEWIGVLERIVALTFVLTGSFTALAFVLTAKSIARFKELEDKQFSEYYILGTSASLIVALFAGMVIRLFFGL